MMKENEDPLTTEKSPERGCDDVEKDLSPAKHGKSQPAPANGGSNSKTAALALSALVALILVIVLSVVLTRNDDDDGDEYVPVTTNFITGVSLITSYNVNATISQRLARTVLTMEIANALDCVSIHGVTLQLPMAARVASLSTVADDGCTTRGDVQPLKEARESFAENAAAGLPVAYVEARDDISYSLQVSLPPMGTTTVELVIEELLRQKVNQVEFQLPFVPNEEVDQISLQIEILDAASVFAKSEPNSTTSEIPFVLGLGSDLEPGMITSPYALEVTDARQHDLPRILRGEYKPKPLPDQGVLLQDGNCFEYTFLPGSLTQPKPKNVFFLLDISSTHYDDHFFFQAVKAAVKAAIDQLTPQDTFTIQTYGRKGTMNLWGSNAATETEKEDAKNFIEELAQECCGTNFHEAVLEGLLRANSDAKEHKDDGVVTLIIVISNSWASEGQTNRTKIAEAIWKQNKDGNVKLFSLGSRWADNQLLSAIAVMNGGVTTSVVESLVDHETQISNFFASEFGNILLSDVNVRVEGTAGAVAYGETPLFFPVLASGTEVVVRGLVDYPSNEDERTLQAFATAVSPTGPRTWTTDAVADPFVATVGGSSSRCFQSYAHARITQLLRLRDVALLLGDSVVEPIVELTRECNKTTSFADCMKEEALSLALEAQVVTRGLTGLVTIDDEMCLAVDEEAEICLDGTNKGDFWETERDTFTSTEEGEDAYDGVDSFVASEGYGPAMSGDNGSYLQSAASRLSLFGALVTLAVASLFLSDLI